jgi:hypothetical protein
VGWNWVKNPKVIGTTDLIDSEGSWPEVTQPYGCANMVAIQNVMDAAGGRMGGGGHANHRRSFPHAIGVPICTP